MSLVLVDATVFVDYFRGRSPNVRAEVARLISKRSIAVVPPTIAELLYGVRADSDQTGIMNLARGSTVLGDNLKSWIAAGELGARWRARGRTLSMVDCLMAAVAADQHIPLWTLDADFKPLFDRGEVLEHRLPGRKV